MNKLEHKTVCGWFNSDSLTKRLDSEFANGWSISYNSWVHELDVSWKIDEKYVPIYFFCVLQRLVEPSLDE